VAAPIRIGPLDAIEASDLAQALGARGLTGRTVVADDERWVVVQETHEQTERLVADVSHALETWLDDRDRSAVDVHVEGRVLSVGRHTDLREALRARVTKVPRGTSSP
jgi:hypothetical protein